MIHALEPIMVLLLDLSLSVKAIQERKILWEGSMGKKAEKRRKAKDRRSSKSFLVFDEDARK